MFEMRIDAGELVDIGRLYDRAGKQAPKEMSRALNDGANRGKTAGIRDIARRMTVPQKTVRQDIGVNGASAARLHAIIYANHRRIGLEEVGRPRVVRKHGGGVTVGKWGFHPNTFVGRSGVVRSRRRKGRRLYAFSPTKQLIASADVIVDTVSAKFTESFLRRLSKYI